MSKLPDPNTLDWGSMSKAEFKRRELEYELQHEDNGYAKVYIDGKFWKEMPHNQALRAAQTLRSKGKDAQVFV